MKKFVATLVVFTLPILISGIILQLLLSNIPNDYKYKKEFLDKNSNKIQTLFLGSSHIYYGINPDYIKNKEYTFNAAYVAQYLNYDLKILQKYEHNFKSLKNIVIPIDYFTLYGRLENGPESWRKKNYALYYGISFDNDISDKLEILSQFKSNINKLYQFYYLKENSITCNKLGWGFGFDSKVKNDMETTGKIAAIRHSSKDDRYFNENLAILKEIVNFSKSRGIKLYMITTPAYPTYTKNLNQSVLNRTINSVKKLVDNSQNIYYNNFINSNDFNESDFFDADHLNNIGAKKLSKKVDSLINLN